MNLQAFPDFFIEKIHFLQKIAFTPIYIDLIPSKGGSPPLPAAGEEHTPQRSPLTRNKTKRIPVRGKARVVAKRLFPEGVGKRRGEDTGVDVEAARRWHGKAEGEDAGGVGRQKEGRRKEDKEAAGKSAKKMLGKTSRKA